MHRFHQLFPLRVEPAERKSLGVPKILGIIPRGLSTRDRAEFTRQMADLLGAGVPLDRALNILYRQTENPLLQAGLREISEQVREGRTLSDAMLTVAPLFTRFHCMMVKAGETSGQLEEVLNRLADHLEREDNLRQQVKTAMAYPILLLCVAAGAVTFLFGYLIPKLADMFLEAGRSLPLPTQIMLFLSGTVVREGWIVLVAFVVKATIGYRVVQIPKVGLWLDKLKYRLPLIGELVKKIVLTRFLRTLATLMKGGVPILSAMDEVKETAGSPQLSLILEKAHRDIKEGRPVAETLSAFDFFPPALVNIAAIGEETGELETMFLRLANVYDREIEVGIKRAVSLFEPAIIFAMGVIVAFVVISVLLPIIELNATV
ncbi:MAG: type II secretion system F family protein [Armatimonadetes bacterium]|nr:type II secretion system F family protein [Armatimonadota bacterium]